MNTVLILIAASVLALTLGVALADDAPAETPACACTECGPGCCEQCPPECCDACPEDCTPDCCDCSGAACCSPGSK